MLNYRWAFIGKPFLAKKLAEMGTEVLHTPDKAVTSSISAKTKRQNSLNRFDAILTILLLQ